MRSLILSSVFIAALVSLPSVASAQGPKSSLPPPPSADGGNSGVGGGDALSKNIRHWREKLGDDGRKFKPYLKVILANLLKLRPEGKISQQIFDLAAQGLEKDIDTAEYELKARCEDDHGRERLLATVRARVQAPYFEPSPEICLNVRMLAREMPSDEALAGAFFHDHARHFGLEDTDAFESHPIADFIETKVAIFVMTDLYKSQPILPNAAVFAEDKGYGEKTFHVYTTRPEEVFFAVGALTGNCRSPKASEPRSDRWISFGPGSTFSKDTYWIVKSLMGSYSADCTTSFSITNSSGQKQLPGIFRASGTSLRIVKVDLSDFPERY